MGNEAVGGDHVGNEKLDPTVKTVCKWVCRFKVDQGGQPSVTTDEGQTEGPGVEQP